jgi:hypothetical protein
METSIAGQTQVTKLFLIPLILREPRHSIFMQTKAFLEPGSNFAQVQGSRRSVKLAQCPSTNHNLEIPPAYNVLLVASQQTFQAYQMLIVLIAPKGSMLLQSSTVQISIKVHGMAGPVMQSQHAVFLEVSVADTTKRVRVPALREL